MENLAALLDSLASSGSRRLVETGELSPCFDILEQLPPSVGGGHCHQVLAVQTKDVVFSQRWSWHGWENGPQKSSVLVFETLA